MVRLGIWATFVFSFIAAAQSGFLVSPNSLRFVTQVTDKPLPSQSVILVNSARSALPLSAVVEGPYDGEPAPGWLSVTPADLSTPARLTVKVQPKALQQGFYSATIKIRSRASTNGADLASIPVTLEVKTAIAVDVLTVTPKQPAFTSIRGAAPQDQLLILSNPGPSGLDCSRITVTPGNSWLRANVESGDRCLVRLSASASSLGIGGYVSSVKIKAPFDEVTVPVSFFVSANGPLLNLNPAGFQFEARETNGNSVTRNLTVLNNGDAPLSFTAEVVDTGETPWLSLPNPSGTVAPGATASVPVTVDTARLSDNAYYGLIRVTAPGARNSPQDFPVVFLVRPADSPPLAGPSPSGLLFSAEAGSAAPAQTVTVFTSSTGSVPYQAAVQTVSGAGWLTIDKDSGNTSTANPAKINVTASAAGLKPGIYTGELDTIIISGDSVQVRSVNITFSVRPASVPGAARNAAGCAPTKLAATHTGLVSNFVTRTGWPTPLNVRLVDDCGDLVTDAVVVLNFSNNDPSLALVNLNNGNYAGTWTPQFASPSTMSVTADVFRGALTTSVELLGSVEAQQTPVLGQGGIVNGFNRQSGAPVAPGMFVEVFGTSLGGSAIASQFENGALPVKVGDVQVLVGGRRAALYFVSPGQVNVQIPLDLPPAAQYQMILRAGQALSTPQTVSAISSSPGLLGFAQDVKGQLITPDNPAHPGDTIVLYLVGMGVTNPPLETGQQTPAQLLETVDPVEVTVNGSPVKVLFSGLTPFFAGLYQVNVTLPQSLAKGDLTLIVNENGTPSNSLTLPVR